MNDVVINFDINKLKGTGEALKALRANVQFCGTDVHSIVITSCLPGDGKSTISIGLSMALAQAGRKVLLIDADLRKSVMLKQYTDAVGFAGLSEFLSGLASLDDVKKKTQIGNLDIIFCGQYPANPTELLSSSAFKNFIAEEKKKYDYVIVDTPPLGLVVDSAVIASVCDSAIMVLAQGKIKSKLAVDVKEQLEKSGVRIIGAVLNKESRAKEAYDYRYSGYMGKYMDKYVSEYISK